MKFSLCSLVLKRVQTPELVKRKSLRGRWTNEVVSCISEHYPCTHTRPFRVRRGHALPAQNHPRRPPDPALNLPSCPSYTVLPPYDTILCVPPQFQSMIIIPKNENSPLSFPAYIWCRVRKCVGCLVFWIWKLIFKFRKIGGVFITIVPYCAHRFGRAVLFYPKRSVWRKSTIVQRFVCCGHTLALVSTLLTKLSLHFTLQFTFYGVCVQMDIATKGCVQCAKSTHTDMHLVWLFPTSESWVGTPIGMLFFNLKGSERNRQPH